MLSRSFTPRGARIIAGSLMLLPLLAACTVAGVPMGSADGGGLSAALGNTERPHRHSPDDRGPSAGVNASIGRYAALYQVPESLVRRIIVRESNYNSSARHGPYWGLMQIRYDTARSMGYSGAPGGLLDPEINLRYGVRYLSGAYKVARGNPDRAVAFYASGYFYDARRMGLLEEVGLKRSK